MKKIVFVLFIIIPAILIAQWRPTDYSLGQKALKKITDETPVSNSITDIVVDDKGIIWLGTSRGLSKSEDNGDSWTNYYNQGDFKKEGIIAIGYNQGTIWVSTGHGTEVEGSSLPEGSGLLYSNDDGTTWTKIEQPVDSPGDSSLVYGINTMRALPVTTTIQNITYDIAFTKNTVWIASFAGGLRKSTDMGQTWQRVVLPKDNLNNIKPTDQLNYSLQPVAGKFGNEGYLNHRLFSVVGIDDTTIYVGTAGGINKSSDNGISWTNFRHNNQDKPISGNFVTALGYDKATKSVWGATWKAEDQNEFWAVSSSSNGGESWDIYLNEEKAHNFGYKYFGQTGNLTSSHVFVPTDNGIFRSSNNGITWLSPPTIQDDISHDYIDTKIFFAAASKTLPNGSTDIWIGSASGLAKINETNGLWEGKWKVVTAVLDNKKSYAFPNPFNPNTERIKIKYPVQKDGSTVSIRIFDFGMNLVRNLMLNAPRNKNDKTYDSWDGKNEQGSIVPNGVYFYRVDINDGNPLFGKIMLLK